MCIRTPTLFLSMIGLLASCTGAPGKLLPLSSSENGPPIAAEFETLIEETDHHRPHAGSHIRTWRLWRSADRIETLEVQGNIGEAWCKSPDNQISYERIFHADKQVIDYTPGDLKALGGEPDWRALATLVDPTLIQHLTARGTKEVLGRQAVRYSGEVKEASLEIWWLGKEQIPAMIKQASPDRTLTTVLKEIHPLLQSPWPHERSGTYRYTDYADIGDKENDPFLKSILHQIKGGHVHSH